MNIYKNYGLLLGGKWENASDQGRLTVFSPVTELEIGTIPQATDLEVSRALQYCQEAAPLLVKTPAWERAKILRKTADLIRERVEEYAVLMSTETGKPLLESQAEVRASADQFEWYGEEAKRIYGQTIPGRNSDERLSVHYQPVGPCLTLSAWNFPMLLPSRKIAAALAAGCPVIARPASESPGSCLVLGQTLMDAGLPKGALSILTGEPTPMVSQLINSPVIKKVSLTGSVPVGKEILKQCADGIKKISMELGGHAPVIVYPDVDPVAAAKKLAATKFRNCGQVCISPSRFYVHHTIFQSFAETFKKVAEKIQLGNGLDDGVTMGPLIRKRALENSLELIEDARGKGATVITGGSQSEKFNKGYFLEPTVLVHVTDEARIMRDEPFAPIAPLTGFKNFDEVIKRANATPFGLASYVFTHDSELATVTADALEAGMVGINETLLATAEAPFGGIKSSGFGREGGSLGIFDYLVPKYIRHKLIRKVDVE